MTPAMFFLGDISADSLLLTGADAHHAAVVRRLGVGERVDVSDGVGAVAQCVVASAEREAVALTVIARRLEPPPQPRLVVVQALAKGDAGESAVTAMTEVGVDEIVPWSAARSVVSWTGERGAKSLERWRVAAREAAKQSRRPWLPVVADLATTTQVTQRLRSAAMAVVLHENATVPLAAATVPDSGEVVVVVGPEGGLTDDELVAFGSAFCLGPSVLRAATAGVAATAVLLSRTTRWGTSVPSRA
jgi:16S rRNA (uracil1498-N3)-methyltransferase